MWRGPFGAAAGRGGGRLVSINTSPGGVPKLPRAEVAVSLDGLGGDGHVYRHHGGAERAVVIYARELIEALQREGHPIAIGTTGENFTVEGIDWSRVGVGTVFAVGAEVRVEVTKFTTPCATITGSFADGDSDRIAQKVHPGWSRVCCRVLAPGIVRPGDAVSLL